MASPIPDPGVPVQRRLASRQPAKLPAWVDWALPLVLFVGIFAVIMFLTRNGPDVSPDSASYLGAAHNLLAGRGLTTPAAAPTSTLHFVEQVRLWGRQPYVEFGPLYPLLLAATSLVGMSLLTAARVVNSASIALLSLMGLLITRRLQADRYFLPLVIGVFVTLSPTVSEGFLGHYTPLAQAENVLSEPVGYGLVALSLFLYLRFLQEGSSRTLELSLLCAGFAALDRFQLLSLVFAEVVVTGFVAGPSWRRRFDALVRSSVCGFGPLALFEVVDRVVFHEQTGEPIRYHPAPHVVTDLLSWLFGGLHRSSLSSLLTAIILISCLSILVAGRARIRQLASDRSLPAWSGVLVLYVVGYVAFLWMTRTWLNGYLSIDQRIVGLAQLGVYLLLVTLVCLSLSVLRSYHRWRAQLAWFSVVTSIGLGGLLVVAGTRNTEVAVGPERTPSELRALESRPNALVLSNDTASVYLTTGHASVVFPVISYPTIGEGNPRFTKDLRDMGATLAACGGYVVVFPGLAPGWGKPVTAVVRVAQSHGRLHTYPDGVTVVVVKESQQSARRALCRFG